MLLIFPLHCRVPVVLDGVVRSAWDQLCDFCPLVAPLLVGIEDDSVLLVSPGCFLDLRVEVIVPPLPTLLPNPPLQMLGNKCPPLRPVFPHKFNNFFIFLFGPRS